MLLMLYMAEQSSIQKVAIALRNSVFSLIEPIA
jgi:hypothetical protein